MLLKGLFKHTKIPLLSKSLRASAIRQRVIANNIANSTTLGYRRLDVRFEEDLQKALRRKKIDGSMSHQKHIPVGGPSVSRIEPKVYRIDDATNPSGVNNVDIEFEMAQLAKNQMLYIAAAKFAAGNFAKIKMAIRGRA
ncbi:MAG: flagellar basal body rod protein FlgB [candidate division KSB1 bacterium]|nr:flagellar basal body rod protein FlgB [candidate division KSB1 bacterium]